ncbi:MAG: DUF5615 family PIN-like protein [Phycisphaerales bacterium]|nr:DUF5615 family PIN-like protein [Phycisphaerales bacterium]
MKLLFDQNLSHRLVVALSDIFPDAAHVRDRNMERAADATIWDFAGTNGYTIVSKDGDFHQRSFLHGPPPKVVWLRMGNCSSEQIAEALRRNAVQLFAFERDPDAALLVL